MAKSGEQRNSPKACLYQHGVTVQIEHFSYSSQDLCFYLGLVRRQPNSKPRRADHGFDADNSSFAFQVKHALEGICRDPFQPGNQMRLVKSHDRLPIVGRFKRQMDLAAADVIRLGTLHSSRPLWFHRRSLIGPTDFARAHACLSRLSSIGEKQDARPVDPRGGLAFDPTINFASFVAPDDVVGKARGRLL